MKKKVLMLAGLLSCLMMVFSVQAGFAETEAYGSPDKGGVINHHHYTTNVNVYSNPSEKHQRIAVPTKGQRIIVAPTSTEQPVGGSSSTTPVKNGWGN